MADNASRDGNFVTTLLAVSNVDGVTPVKLWADPVTHRLLTSPTGSGSGDVVGPASSTDNAIVRFDSTTGKLIQNSVVTISDTGAINVAGAFTLPIVDGTNLQVLKTNGSGTVSWGSVGTGTVTTLSIATANGFAGTVATATTTPVVTLTTSLTTPVIAGNGTALIAATTTGSTSTVVLQTSPTLITPILGVAAATSINKVTITAPATSATLTIADGKTLTVNNILTLAGTDSTTMTFPTTSATLARTDAANTFTGASTASAWVLTSPTITTKISPTTDDGAPLGDVTHNFSDLFLATGGVINWANGETTLTEAAGILTATYPIANGTNGIGLQLYTNSSSPAATDIVGMLDFYGKDSAANKQLYSRIKGVITSTTSTAESGDIVFATVAAGALADRASVSSTALSPATNDGIALGTAALSFSDVFLAEGGVINWDNGDATLTQVGDVVTLAGADLKVTTPGNAATSALTTNGTQTVTNKRIQPRTASSTTSSNLSPDLSTANVYYRTTQTATLTIDAPIGTPVIGETIIMYVDSAGAQTLTINSTYKAFGAAFPATSTAGKTFMMSAQFNGTDWKTLWANAV